ncbi:MAG: peptidoglycan-binding protein, partial [Psychromonas sp.]|nr:peptidoglycan-binding protein [Psychromonas sp.]
DFNYLNSNEDSSLKLWWRVSFLALLLLALGWQSSKIANYFLPSVYAEKEQSASIISANADEIKAQETLIDTTSKKQIAGEPLNLTAQKESVWFDDYPLFDFSQGEFSYALRSLYAIWGYQVNLTETNCQRGSVVSLFCFSEKSNINKLKQLNYPAVIKLENGEQSLYVVLYKVSDHYQLIIGDQSINVSPRWLQRYWHGGLTLLWQAPFTLDKALKFGQKSKRVAWLKQQFNKIDGLSENNNPRFDLVLLQRVKQFQRDNFLIADGIVGARTLMVLMQALHPKFPRLIAETL